jgi:hypothetical protein
MDMRWIEISLGRLERQLREFIEGRAGTPSFSQKFLNQLELELIAASQPADLTRPSGHDLDSNKQLLPDVYTLLLPQREAEEILTHPEALNRLVSRLKINAAEHGYQFANEPMIKVIPVPDLDQIKVQADFSQTDKRNSSTAVVKGLVDEPGDFNDAALLNAFLIVNGLMTYPLSRQVVNLGRDSANQVCLQDERVSRMHAQLRLIQGRYVIFDLDSKGGTFVNGIQVNRHVLNPGDVILLGGVPLVFGQDQGITTGYTQELPAPLPPPEVL